MNNLKNLGLGLVLLAQASFCMTARASDYSFERDQCKATVQAIAKGLAIGAQGKVGVITVDSLTDTREYSVNITNPFGLLRA